MYGTLADKYWSSILAEFHFDDSMASSIISNKKEEGVFLMFPEKRIKACCDLAYFYGSWKMFDILLFYIFLKVTSSNLTPLFQLWSAIWRGINALLKIISNNLIISAAGFVSMDLVQQPKRV